MAKVPLAGQFAPSLSDLERLGRAAYDGLPQNFRALCGDVLFQVEDFPSGDVLTEMKAEPFDLLGLFQGVGLAHDEAVAPTGRLPNMVFLYRRAILDYWAESHETLGSIVTHVLIHEIGHHFGLSDADMDAIEKATA